MIPLEQFQADIEREFIQGSAIDPSIYHSSIRVVSDNEIGPGGEVSTPIHDALGWHYARFGHQVKETLHAALFVNEDGSIWQAKLNRPAFKDSDRPYAAPKGNGARAFLPAIPVSDWVRIAEKNGAGENLPIWVRLADAGGNGEIKSGSSECTDFIDRLRQQLSILTASPEKCAQMDGSDWDSLRTLPIQSLNQTSLKPASSTQSGSQTTKSGTRDGTASATRTMCASEWTISGLSDALSHPQTVSFWDWIEAQPEIRIAFTEGGKKSDSGLTAGHVTIALYGVNAGYSAKDRLGNRIPRHLIPDVERFLQPGRRAVLAFDQDSKVTARKRVNVALQRFGGLLRQSGAEVSVANWDQSQGKGIDDLIAAHGPAAAATAIDGAMPFDDWCMWQRLTNRLTYTPALEAPLDMVDTDQLPLSGIVAIAAAKGTGKTKLIARTTGEDAKALALGHRIALMRNLCQRLGLDYRGDITGAKRAGVVTSGVYRIGLGACVDALLSINPDDFNGCDLILDEVVQVVRHLLTSSTCAQNGKRPALLARFHQLIQASRRVIVADADLDNAVLRYLQQLRDDGQAVYLVKGHSSRLQGYPALFIEAPDRSAIVGMILDRAAELPAGQVLYVATDSKASSKDITRLLLEQLPHLRVLTINSETSGSPDEREFIQTPDTVLERGDYDVIICTPSLATGVSIEVQGVINRVYGVFQGVSSTDADMAQTLIRVREPVQRAIWCNRTGSNFSRISRSTNPLELRSHLMSRTTATVSLTRSQLREDSLEAMQGYNWQEDPHLHMWSIIEAERNRAMLNLRAALLVRLRYEGHQVTVEEHSSNKALRTLLKASRAAVAELDAETLVNADDYTYQQVLELQHCENQTPEQQRAIAKFYLKEFYAMNSLTVDDVLADKTGRRRAELRSLEVQLHPETATARDISSIDKQLENAANWGRHVCPWDVGDMELRRWLRERIGLNDFLDPDKEWTRQDLAPYAERIHQMREQIKVALGTTISAKMRDTQAVHQLLSQLGLKTAFRWSRSMPGLEGKKVRVFRLERLRWDDSITVLERRKAQREALAAAGSAMPLTTTQPLADPDLTAPETTAEPPLQPGRRVRWGSSMSEWEVLRCADGLAHLRIVGAPGFSTETTKPIGDLVSV